MLQQTSPNYNRKHSSGTSDSVLPVNRNSIAVTASNGKNSLLLRLFESKHFDASMAMTYLFQSKEPGVLDYIGNKLFGYSDSEVDVYMPQMANLYIMHHEVAQVLHPYIIHRCRQSVDFSLTIAWLLEAFGSDANVPSKKKSHSEKLKNLIFSGDLVPKEAPKPSLNNYNSNFSSLIVHNNRRAKLMNPNVETLQSYTPGKRTHMTHVRSRSDASGILNSAMRQYSQAPNFLTHPPKPRLALGDLTSGRAFDNGCTCFESCKAAVNDLRGKRTHCEYLTWLS